METNNLRRIYKSIMLIILTAVITFIITSAVMYKQYGNNKGVKYVVTDNVSKTFQTFKNFIEDKYLYDANDKEMLEEAIKGYVNGLKDQYSEYITSSEMKDYMEETVGNYVGIGVYMANDTSKNQIVVLMTIKGSPAEEAGIKSGDIITKVDGVPYSGEQLSEAAKVMRGEEGTSAKIEILRNEDTISLDIQRRKIKIIHIEDEILEENIGYIRISTFDEGCYDEFVQKWNSLKEKGIKSLIIDLRNNGGGIVKEALNIADLMVEKDKDLLITTSKSKGQEITKSLKEKEINIPIVILINNGTASSSEILAGAVKENNNNSVTLIGKTTYGKGVIQTIFTLSDGSGLKLTTNEYFTPNHNAINKVGITPDIEVSIPENISLYSVTRENDTQLQKAIEVLKEKM